MFIYFIIVVFESSITLSIVSAKVCNVCVLWLLPYVSLFCSFYKYLYSICCLVYITMRLR